MHLKRFSRPAYIRSLVPGVYKPEFPRDKIEHPFKGRYEQPLAVGLAQKTVDFGEHLAQIPS